MEHENEQWSGEAEFLLCGILVGDSFPKLRLPQIVVKIPNVLLPLGMYF